MKCTTVRTVSNGVFKEVVTRDPDEVTQELEADQAEAEEERELRRRYNILEAKVQEGEFGPRFGEL